MKLLRLIFTLSIVCFFCACSDIQKVSDIVMKPSAREVYAREFEHDSFLKLWNQDLKDSKVNKLSVTSPFLLSGVFRPNKNQPLAYTIFLQKGESFHVDVLQTVDSSKVFIDLFRFENDSILVEKSLFSSAWENHSINYDIQASGKYKIIIQPEILANTDFNLLIYTKPTLGFPVAGKENSSIQSFWGNTRDGGRRSHEGVDIFATRGTPAVAVMDGYVTSAGERGLGGKQVWLRSGAFGYSLYYAHLDSIAVTRGKKITLGDTLGFIGNTGNAKTTSPHLHFGVYTKNGA